MTLLFENANANSLDKKWYATNVLPIPTPLQVALFKQSIQEIPIRIYRLMITCIRLEDF